MYNFFLLLLLVASISESKRILAVFPIPSYSHQIVFRPVMQELAKRGHQVTVITPDPEFAPGPGPTNLTELDVHEISYRIFNKNYKESDRGMTGNVAAKFNNISKFLTAGFEEVLNSTQIQLLIHNNTKQFDLLFVESSFRASLGFSHLYNVKIIEFASAAIQLGAYHTAGAATHPLIYPIIIQQRIFNLKIWEKLSELYTHYSLHYENSQVEKQDDKVLKRYFGSSILDINDLEKKIHLSLLNVHPIWDFNRPVPPNVIYLGQLHQRSAKELPKDVESYLETSKNGVIYVSFGTNIRPSLLPSEKLNIFKRVFSRLSFDILWKWDEEELPNCPKNVKISKWFSQINLLNHPKIKLFITQGGLQSTDEAIEAGVPLICIPMFWDQWFNAEQYVKHNIGVNLSFETLTEDKLENAINTVMKNQSYRDNVLKFRNIVHDKPQTSLERAVWWTEYVLRNGDDVITLIRSPAANMHWIEYFELELLLILSTALLVILILVVFIVRCSILGFRNYYYSKMKVNQKII